MQLLLHVHVAYLLLIFFLLFDRAFVRRYFSLQKLILKFIKANADLREGNVLKKKKSGGDSKKNSTKKNPFAI